MLRDLSGLRGLASGLDIASDAALKVVIAAEGAFRTVVNIIGAYNDAKSFKFV